MTEQEVIKYLKKNRVEGVIISFTPKEVQNFCHLHKQNLLVWQSGQWYKFDADDIADDDVVTLSDNFELEEKSQGSWVEFEIDQRGNFHCFKDDNMHYFFWANWGIFLKAFSDEYTAFGGWKYENDERWYLAPAIQLESGYWNSYEVDKSIAKPAIPEKIRFWRSTNEQY